MTAVEWLYNKLSTCTSDEMVGNVNNWFEQAMQMEKKQIVKAFNDGHHADVGHVDKAWEYYNQEYNQNK